MPNQAELAYKIPTYNDSLSSSEVLYTPSSAVVTEPDNFNQEWSASQPTNSNNVYTIKHPSTELPLWFDNVLERLNDLLNLPTNWDTYGADKIDLNSAILAIEILVKLFNKNIPESSIVPVNDGGIQLEWHINGANLEICIQSDRTAEYYFYHDQNVYQEKENEFKFNSMQLPEDFNQCIDTLMECVEN